MALRECDDCFMQRCGGVVCVSAKRMSGTYLQFNKTAVTLRGHGTGSYCDTWLHISRKQCSNECCKPTGSIGPEHRSRTQSGQRGMSSQHQAAPASTHRICCGRAGLAWRDPPATLAKTNNIRSYVVLSKAPGIDRDTAARIP